MLKQVPNGSVFGDYRESISIRWFPEELSVYHAIDWLHYEEDGLGPAIGAAFKASNGHHFVLGHLFHTRTLGRQGSGIATLYQSPEEADTADAALCDLGLTLDDAIWIREDLRFTPCDLVRQDDHGVQYVVGTYRCRADAMAAQRRLTASVHKQDYWIHTHEPTMSCA